MGLLFKDDLHDESGTWPLACIPYGGADVGEVVAVAQARPPWNLGQGAEGR